MDKTTKPKFAVDTFYDDHEKKASEFYEKFFKEKKDPELLLKASEEFALSTNPEGDKISVLCKGLYFREKAVLEKNHSKAKKLILKAMTEFKQIDPTDVILKQLELDFLKRKMLESRKKRPELSILEKSANIHKELGHEKAYHVEMGLYHMFFIMDNLDKLSRDEILKNADLMLEHAMQGQDQNLLHKTEGLYHQIKAKHVNSSAEALKEFEKAMEAIEKTSDKYGKDMVETELLMTKAMATTNTKKRNELLENVAQRYHKSGQKVKEDFVKKLMSPVPLKAAKIVYFADQSLEKLRELEKKINQQKGAEAGPFLIFYHLSYMMERIKDVRRTLIRMAITRKSLTELHIKSRAMEPTKITPGKPLPKRLNAVHNRINELGEQMRQDMESLLIYGNLLLDQWAYLIGHLAGFEVPEKVLRSPEVYFKDFLDLFADENTKSELKKFWANHKKEAPAGTVEMNFFGLLNLLQARGYNGDLKDFWDKHKKDIIWLNFHLRYFRNVFIEHLRKPWQRGNTMGVYTDDFNLHIPAAVGFIKPEEEKRILEEIYPLSPQRLKDMPDDYWEKKKLRRVLEVTLYFIDEIENQADRDKVWSAWNKLGGSTPSYDTIAGRLFNYIFTSIATMIEFIDKNPSLIKMGKF